MSRTPDDTKKPEWRVEFNCGAVVFVEAWGGDDASDIAYDYLMEDGHASCEVKSVELWKSYSGEWTGVQFP